jgi:SNF2 family DNA or RNA helicase
MAERKSLEPWLKDEVIFRDYQVDGVRFMIQRQNPLQADEMGLGKSLQAIATFSTDVKMGWGETLIVVAPVTLKANWANEFRKFTNIPYTVLGEEMRDGRRRKLDRNERDMQIVFFAGGQGPRALIVNYEQVVAHLDMLNAVGFHMAVFDESHYLGNSESQRTMACLALQARRKIPMTGTPVTKNVHNLWALLRMTWPGTPPFATFMNRHAVYGGFKKREIVGIKRKEEIHEILGRIMIRRLQKDVLDLKEPNIIQRWVELTDVQRKLYDEVEKEMQLTIDPDEPPEEYDNHLFKNLRLRQLCGTTYEFNGEDNSNKLTAAIEDTLEIVGNGHRLVVFTQFRPMVGRYVARLQQAAPNIPVWELHGDIPATERFDIVERWEKSTTPGVIVCMMQVTAFGLNMTAGSHGIFLDKHVTPAVNRQAIARLNRIGQDVTKAVTIIEYITVDTVEVRVEEICAIKDETADELVEEAVREGKSNFDADVKGAYEIKPPVPRGQLTIPDIAHSLPH